MVHRLSRGTGLIPGVVDANNGGAHRRLVVAERVKNADIFYIPISSFSLKKEHIQSSRYCFFYCLRIV